jgi:hypothetical protein
VAFVWTVEADADADVAEIALWSLNDIHLATRLVERYSHRFVDAIE